MQPREPRYSVGRLADEPRAVGGDQHVGFEPRFMLLAERLQARRTEFLAGLQHELRIEAELAALGDHGLQRRHVDRVLAFVVGGAASVIAVAFLLEHPRPMPARHWSSRPRMTSP